MTLKHATAATGVARDHHHFRNPVTGKVERALLVEPSITNLVEFNIPGGTPADWEVQQLDAITNLSSEYGLVIDEGDSFPVADPGNFDPDSFAFGEFYLPRFASTDGAAHVFGQWYADANNYIEWGKDAAGDVYLTVVANGTTKTASLTVAFAAGAAIYVGGTLASGTLTLRAGTAASGTLGTDSETAVPASTGASWEFFGGSDQAGVDQAEGALNLVWTTDGTTAAIATDRFNSGAGMAIEEWMNRHSDKLVLLVDGTSSAYRLRTVYGAAPAVTRNDTGTQTDWTGTVKAVAVNILRNLQRIVTNESGSPSRRVTLLERAATNLLTYSQDYSNAAWAKSNITLTGSQTAPDGTSTAYKVEAAASGATNLTRSTTPAATSTAHVYSVWVKKGSGAAEANQFILRNNTTATNLTTVNFNYDTLAITGAGAANARVVERAGSWTRISLWASSGITVGDVLTVYVGFTGGAATAGQHLYAWGAQLEAGIVPSSYIVTTSAADPRAADSFTVDLLDATPQEATYLYEGVLLDLANTGTIRSPFNLGGAGVGSDNAGIKCYLDASTARLYVKFSNGSASASGYWDVSTASLADNVAVRIYWNGTDAPTMRLTINAAAEAAPASAPGVLALPGSWLNNHVRFSGSTGVADCNSGLISFKAQSGAEKTLAEMQALVDPDICVYRSGQISELASVSANSPTKGAALPAIDGKGGAWGVADASSVSASSEGIPLPYDSSLGSTIVKLTTGPAGSGVRRYRIGLNGEMNGFSAGGLGAFVVGVYIPAACEVGFADVKLFAVDDVGSTEGMAAPGDDDWHWLIVVREWDAAATEAYFELRFADGVTLAGANEVLYMALPSAAVKAFGAPIANSAEGSSTATGADTVYDTSPDSSLVAQTIYLRGYEVGTAKAGGTIYHLGSGVAGADPRVIIEATGGVYRAKLDDGTEEVSSAMATAPSPGQLFELRLEILSTGSIQLHQSINAATETDATASAVPAGGLPTALAGDRRYFGSEAGSTPGTLVLTHEARLPGSVSLASCRAFCGL